MKHGNTFLMRLGLAACFLFVLIAATSTGFAQTTYTWNNTGTGNWATAANWTPTRTTPATNDILVFDGSTTPSTIDTGVVTQTIGQLIVKNNARVVLFMAGSANTRTLTIGGGSGTDFQIDAGSTLIDSGNSAITIAIATGATGGVSGTFTVKSATQPTGHRLTAADVSSLTFQSGSLCQISDSLTGNLFGNTGTANTVIFSSGSIYAQKTGSNPFALGQPSSKVTFQAGSLFRLEGSISPSFSGRTYANFQCNTNGSPSASGGNALSIDDLTVSQGTLNIGMTGTFNLKGSVSVASGATLNFNAASAATITLNGTSAQTVSGAGTLTIGANESFNMTNTAGVNFNRSVTMSGGTVTVASGVTLSVASGTTFSTGTGTVTVNGTLATAGTVTNGGTVSVPGSVLQINEGGSFGTTGTYTYGSTAQLIFNNTSGPIAVGSTFAAWPSSSGPQTVKVKNGGGITLNTARTVGTLFQIGNGTQTSDGTNTGVTTNGNLTIDGTAELTNGSYFNDGPIYGSSSTLKYNSGGTYGRLIEWSATSGAGYPHHVQVSGSTTLDVGNADPGTAKQMGGDLTIDLGSTFTMNYQNPPGDQRMTAAVTVLGNVSNSGTLTLSTKSGGDLVVGGNWTRASTFTPNGRQVEFNGSSDQTITVSGGETFDDLRVNKSSGKLIFANDGAVNNTLTLTQGNVDVGSNTLTVGSSGSVSRTSGHVIGNLKKTVSGNTTFEVGTANGYSPAILSNVSGSDLVTTKATQGAHSPAFSANSLQRYWTLTKGAGLTQSDLEFDYLAGDVVGTETNYGIRKYSGGSWSSPGGTVDAVNHKLTIAGVTSFSDWSAGECATITFDQSSPLPQGNQGAPYSQTLTVTGGSSPYSFAVTSGSLPTGLSLSSGGAITGTPTGSGTSNFDVTVTDASGCTAVKNYDLTITGCPVITVSPTSLPNGGGIGAAYDQTFTASGGTGPYTFAVTSGTLPGGLTLESDGHLHGTFTNAGVFNFTVTATDANTCTGSRAYTLVVCESMTFSSLPNGTIGVAYNQTISITSGGTAPYSFTVTAGVLPNGLSMGSDGHITGTPSALGTFDFTVTVTDANGCSDFHAYSVMISCPTITVNPASLPNGRINVAYSQTITASGGTGPYSFTVTSGSLPTGLSLSLGGSLSGTPSAGGSYTFTVTATDANSCTGSRSYTVIIDAPVVFKIAAGPGISPEGTNGVNAVDTLDWRNKATWVIESGVDADSIPDDDDVVLDNSHRSGSYVLRVGTVGPDSCRTITVGYAGNPNTITLLIPKTSTVTNALKFGTNGPGNYDMVIDSGGIVQNSSGKTSGTALNIRGFAAAGDSVLIKPGGKYLHNSKSSVSGIIIGMSKDLDAPGGTFEMDLPGPSSNTRFITMAGGVFPDLILSARDSAITYSPSTSQASAFGSCFIKGTFTVNAGATFLAGTSGGYEGDIFFKGNIVNNSTINFSSNIQNVLAMVGASAQTISGNAITLGKGMFVGNSAGVSLSTDVTVTGGTVQTTGMITYKQPELPGNTFNINAAGVLNTGSSTVFINPGGSMNEGDNPVVGNVSATRTASQSVNETFGSIGYEINAAGGAPGATTILRKTGVASTGNGHQSILRYFDVSPANNSGLNAAISFFYAVSELNGIPENTLILQKSTDGGTTWTGKSGSVNTGLHKIASTGINSFSRWTAAGSGTPLFVSHTITLRKFADADGDPNTTIDQTAKKWRMTLFVDSIAANDTVASANLNSGVLTVQNLEAGTYIAVEQDSTSSGWIRLGRRHNGTLIVGDSQYDTLVVSGGVPGTVDFINQKVSSIMVEKIVDHDGDPNTTGDQVSANWHLELYKGSVAPGNLVTSGDGQSIFASGLQAGIYIACESDSGASWVRINGNHTRYDTLIVTAGSSLTVQFINFRPNTIVVRKFQDNDGLMITEGDRVPKSWYLEVRNDNPSGAIVASGNTTALTLNNVGDGTYYASEGDSADWIHIVSVVNGSNHFPADHYQFSVANGQSVTIDFINAPPIYSRSFRTFDPDSIAFDKDNKGKVGKFVKRKDDKVQVKLRMQAPNAATGFTVKFSMTFTGKIYTDTLKSVVLDSIVNSKEKAVTVAVDSGHVYQLDGWGSKGVQIKGQVIWLTSPKQTKVDYKDPALFALNQRRLPMPNRVNVLFETFAQGGFAPNGLLVGKDRSADSGKQYGWLLSSKYREVLSTLYEKGQIHKGKAHGFDRTTKGKAILKRQKTMKPSLYDNELTAELVALKVNIAASVLVKTPNGFGELLYDDGTSNPLNGKMVKDISTIADSIMMGYYQGGVHTFADSVTFANLLAAVENINNSFEGAMDTNGFAVKLETKGTKQLIQVPYLHWNPSAIPALIAANGPIVETPMAYQLYQNYPNPFNPTTTIQFDLPDQALVTVKIYNILGQEIATLLDHQLLDDGTQEVEFNAQQLASGVYFYRIVAEGVPDDDGAVSNTFQTVKKMMLIK